MVVIKVELVVKVPKDNLDVLEPQDHRVLKDTTV